MNILILAEIKDAHSKMGAYTALLNYRYMNLCVKAEAASLLPVTVETEVGRDNLEDVAFVSLASEDQLAVYPKHKMFLKNIIKGIFDVHPEFKMEMKSIQDKNGDDIHYPLYTMPPVNKDRRDILNTAVESFYQDAKARIEKVNADFQVKLGEIAPDMPAEDLDEVKKEFEKGYRQQKDAIAKLMEDKQDEIGEAYQRYLQDLPEDDWDDADNTPDFDVTQSMKMDS